MNEDIAVVHWTDGGLEKKARAYTLQMLSQLIQTMDQKGFTYYVCLTKLDTIIPISSHKPFKAHTAPLEYVGKVAPRFEPHRAFAESVEVRCPPSQEQVKKAYGQ